MESMETTPAAAIEFSKYDMVKWKPVVDAAGRRIELRTEIDPRARGAIEEPGKHL